MSIACPSRQVRIETNLRAALNRAGGKREMEGNYDSPTFLGRKDKVLLGLTGGQVVVFMVSIVIWSMVAFSMDLGLLARLVLFGPLHALTVAMFTVKIGGTLLPSYLLLALKGMIITPLYHSSDVEVRSGLTEWNAQRRRQAMAGDGDSLPDGTLARLFYRLKSLRRQSARQARGEAAREARYLAEVEFEHHSAEAVQESKRWLKEMWRMLRR